MITAAPLALGLGVVSARPALAEPFRTTGGTTVSPRTWTSGVCDPDPVAFGTWRGSPVGIAGMFGDTSVDAQLEQWQYAHTPGFRGDVDLAVGGPIDHSWAEVAAGAQVPHWKQLAAVIAANWHYRTVYLRFAHEFNGNWMPWSVAPTEVPAFRQAFRLFATTMRTALAGRAVKLVWAPNFGTWFYTPDSAFPGPDVVDVVGVSMYEWTRYDTQSTWKAFLASSIGPNAWSAFAQRHGRPLAFSEWGAQSTLFIRGMRAWMAVKAGRGPGQLLYDVYLNGNELLLTGATAAQYRALRWGST
ncbi:MAG TPA: glycosyl hydrolase [Kineosporiaceae bacterium]